ncbi:MAG: transporter [Chloroflexi bacterium AL-W]|nr:transporter [Chloroflexi bacterium AL-N1]NOK68314.1 transporter [Chloroflexi bacterium AL-N10]NOK73960.1 transporter [Chloroflexi bacterium AL-N5]NOK82928.1 transporter [Chloroflexi bacterium AL-W]NOK90450.1 transporter [Chloroflexi bacterium AL-N15]
MQLSTRNQLPGTIKDIKTDSVMAQVVVELDQGGEMVSVITADSAQRLNLTVGKKVMVMVKATDVSVASE